MPDAEPSQHRIGNLTSIGPGGREACLIAIIWVCYRLALTPWHQVERKAELGGRIDGRDAAQAREIVVIHREDEVEPVEIGRAHLPAAQVRYIDAMRAGYRDRARVGRVTAMPAAGPRRINRPTEIELAHPVPQYAIGKRRATDIAEAYEQD